MPGSYITFIHLQLTSNRWLKASGISIACEEQMRQIAREEVGDNLCGEIAPFTFTSSSGAIELKGAPHIYMPNIIQKITQLLEENAR